MNSTGAKLIAGHSRVHLQAPKVDSARHAAAVFHSLPAQPVHYREAAHTVVAEDDEGRPVIVQFLQVLWYRTHRDQPGGLYPADGMFFGLTNINQPDRDVTVHEILNFEGLYFERKLAH
jgi:hypothetical protein